MVANDPVSAGEAFPDVPVLVPATGALLEELNNTVSVGNAPYSAFASYMIRADCWAAGVKRGGGEIEMLFSSYGKSREELLVDDNLRSAASNGVAAMLEAGDALYVWMFGDPRTCWGFSIEPSEGGGQVLRFLQGERHEGVGWRWWWPISS